MWSLFLIGHPYLMARLVVKNESCREKTRICEISGLVLGSNVINVITVEQARVVIAQRRIDFALD